MLFMVPSRINLVTNMSYFGKCVLLSWLFSVSQSGHVCCFYYGVHALCKLTADAGIRPDSHLRCGEAAAGGRLGASGRSLTLRPPTSSPSLSMVKLTSPLWTGLQLF